MLITRVSTKGQVILPKALRDKKKWPAGTKLEIIERPEGIMLKPLPGKKPYTIRDLAGCLQNYYSGPPVKIEDMDRLMDEALAKDWRRKAKAFGQ